MRNNVLEGFYAELRRQPIPDPDEVKNPLFLEAVFVPSQNIGSFWIISLRFQMGSKGVSAGLEPSNAIGATSCVAWLRHTFSEAGC